MLARSKHAVGNQTLFQPGSTAPPPNECADVTRILVTPAEAEVLADAVAVSTANSGMARVPQLTGRPYLLRVFELPPEAIVHSFCGLFRSANHGLDINFKAAVQQLINFTIVIIIVSVWN